MKIKENTFLAPELHEKLTEQSKSEDRSKSSIINEAVKVYYGMTIDERIARVQNRNSELREELSNGK
jgi:predicted DNA-binding protein